MEEINNSQYESFEENGNCIEQKDQQDLEEGSTDADNVVDIETEGDSQTRTRRRRTQRDFPSVPFEEALELAFAIQKHSSGQKTRRLTLFNLMERSAESGTSRQLVINSSKYGITTGSSAAEYLELTPDGYTATADDTSEREKIRARFKLAIEKIAPFSRLHQHYIDKRLPAKSVMIDFLKDEGINHDAVSECVETFLVNAKFVNVLQNIAGAERLVSLDHVLDQAPSATRLTLPASPKALPHPNEVNQENAVSSTDTISSSKNDSEDPWSQICFYVTPIGREGTEQRMHSDLFLNQIVEPALEEFNLKVVRGEKIEETGIITRQEVQYVMKSRLVIADLSFHNPNVFYELALRHASGLPTVQIIRSCDPIPFDVGQMRTVTIDTTSIYTLVPQLEVYRTQIASQVRRALENSDVADNPFTAFSKTKVSPNS